MIATPGSAGLRFLKLGAGDAAARILSFVATVYLARTLGAGMYGVIVSATTVVMYLAFIAEAGMEMTGLREVTAHPERVPSLLGGVLGGRLVVAGVLVAVATVAGLGFLPAPDGAALALYSGTLVATALGTRFVHLGLERTGIVAWSRVLSESVAALLIVALVRVPNDLLRAPVAQITGDTLAALFLLWRLPAAARPPRLSVDFTTTVALVRKSWPMVLHGLLGLAIFNSDFLFLRVFDEVETVGFYAVAYTFISFIQNLGMVYSVSLIPNMTAMRHDRQGSQRFIDDSMAQVMFAALPATVGGVLVATALVTLLFGVAYAPSAQPLQILLLLVPVALARNVLQAVMVAHGRQDLMLRTVVWAAAGNMVLNLVLIPPFGMLGAATATFVTEAVRTWLSMRYTQTLSLGLPPPRRMARIAAATVVMGVVVLLTRAWPVAGVIAVSAVAYLGALLLVGGIRLRPGSRPELPL